MRKILIFMSLLILSSIYTSCSKDEVLTDGEKLGIQIKRTIRDNNATNGTVFLIVYNSTYDFTSEKNIASGPISVDGQFVKVGYESYNLISLNKYYYDTNSKSIYLFFTE